jgi:hypothetical protein
MGTGSAAGETCSAGNRATHAWVFPEASTPLPTIVLTTGPLSVQWTKVWPVSGVAVTVCELPSANLPPPLTVPSALGDALTVISYCLGLTVSVATRVVLPWLLVVLLKLTLFT